MRWSLELITPPDSTVLPVTLAEMKRHLGEFENVTDRDADVASAAVAAREALEEWTGRALIDQTWKLTFGDEIASVGNAVTDPRLGSLTASELRGTEVYLRRSPFLSVVSFVSIASDGTETAIAADAYGIRDSGGKFPRIAALSGDFRLGRYAITFRAGYADRDVSPQEGAEVIPERWKSAIKLMAEALYHRDLAAAEKLEATAKRLLQYDRAVLDFA